MDNQPAGVLGMGRSRAARTVLALGMAVNLVAGAASLAATKYNYDSKGRLVSVVYDDGKRIDYSYDDAGNRQSVATNATAGNLPPVAGDDAIAVNEGGGPITFDPRVNDTDPNGDAMTVAAAISGARGGVTFTTTSVTYTIQAGRSGPSVDQFVYSVKDTANLADTGVVVVTISNVAPTAVGDSVSSTSAGVDFNAMANDSDAGQDRIFITGLSDPPHGAAYNFGGGTVRYVPDPGYSGSDSFTYTLKDEDGGTATGTISVTVNNFPVAGDDSFLVGQSAFRTVDPRGNDTDPDGQTLTITGKTNGAHGAVTFTATSVTYAPTTGYLGSDTFTYTVSDGAGGVDTASVAITVIANTPPNAVDDTKVAVTAAPSMISPLGNDSDPEGQYQTVIATSSPAHGTTTINSFGTVITYTSSAGFTGTDSFTYTIQDTAGATDTATITVTVNATNSPPNAVNDSLEAFGYFGATASGTLDVRLNDTDPEGNPLTITGLTNGTKGTTTLLSNGSVYYFTNTTTAMGADSFTYTISDGAGGTDTATVNVWITKESPE